MIRFAHTESGGFEHAIRGMRHPFKGLAKSDSQWGVEINEDGKPQYRFVIGPKDKNLCLRLNRAGSPHNKFLRQIVCWTDVTAPRFWWIEMDTYRVGVEKDSESTMHTIMKTPFAQTDFSDEIPWDVLTRLNELRDKWRASEDADDKAAYWRQLVAELPQSYLQTRTVMMSYQTIREIIRQRDGHKIFEWADFIAWAKTLQDSWLLFDAEDGHEE